MSNEDQTKLKIFIWNNSIIVYLSYLAKTEYIVNEDLSIDSDGLIQNVITTDFNNDGKMDVLLITKVKESDDYKESEFLMNIYFGKDLYGFGIDLY